MDRLRATPHNRSGKPLRQLHAQAIMVNARPESVETLATPEARAGLPLLQLLRLYLDPGALFKDASRGSACARERALTYNRRMRWMLVPYIRRWTAITASFFFGIA